MTSQYFSLTILICFIKIIAISCKRYGSLSLVIDDTTSMQSEIDSVKKESSKFMDIILTNNASQINDVVIVTFNDPGTRGKFEKSELRLHSTRNRNEVKRSLNKIKTDVNRFGGDCPEYSLTGINTALKYSSQNSYLFVFTDASPKDGYYFVREKYAPRRREIWKLNATVQTAEIYNVIKFAGSKESQVKYTAEVCGRSLIFFFITKGHCAKPEPEIRFQPYWDIAAATNGEVFKINKKEDLEYYLNYMNIIISGESNLITRKELKANEIASIPFTVDDQTEFVRVSASSQGDNVFLNISSGPTRAHEKKLWTKNNKVLIINSPAPGNYSVTVQGSGFTTISVNGRTDFTFQHGFSETTPPTFSNEKPQPIEGIKSKLLVKVYDPTKSVDIKTAQISSIDEKTIYYDALTLTKVSDDYYVTKSFLAPNTLFVLTVIGEGKKTGAPIKRTAKTPIQPRPQDMDPLIKIQGGGKHKYNSDVLLTCSVTAYPKPKNIVWMNNKEKIIAASPIKEKNRKEFVTSYSYKNLKHETVLYCCAETDNGEIFKQRVDLDTYSAFKVNPNLLEASVVDVVVEFGKPATLSCDITADIPMKIVWFHIVNNDYTELKDLSSAHSKYSISNHGRKLTINRVDEYYKGHYLCKAIIIDDKDEYYQLERRVEIQHTAPIMGNTEHIEINEGESKSLSCTILKGYPKPEIYWEFKDYKSKIFRPLNKTGDRLQINNANHLSAGLYKCIATNYKGTETQETKLTVSIRPQAELRVNGKASTRITIEYNDIKETLLTCHILSHSQPAIVWKNGKNEVLTTSMATTKNNEYEYISMMKKSQLKKSETYHCEATNQISTTKSKSVHIEVSNPFSKVPPGEDNDIKKANNGEKVVIQCGITSRFPNKITWYKETGEVVQTSARYFIAENGKSLTIRKMDMDTAGKYICNSSIIGDEATQETHKTTVDIILENPKVETKYRDLEVFRDQNALLRCKVLKGFPRPTITWKVKYEKSNEFVTLPDVGEILNLSPAFYNHTGEYKCVLKNSLGSDEGTVRLFVKGPPVILVLNPSDIVKIAIVGDDVLPIPCEVAGYPKPNITWISEYPDSKTKYSVNSNGTLIIKNPTTEDSDNKFTCIATNEFGQAKETFDTVVEQTIGDHPQYTGGIKNIVVLKDTNNTHLKCESGSLKGRWFKNEDPTGITGTLTVDSVLESFDDGSSYHGTNYTCRINDINGSKSYTYNVKIEYQPILIEPIEEPIDWDGSEINLSCDVYMRPENETAKAKWYYNGKESYLSDGRAHLSKHPIISWGNYTCIISNKHGFVKKNFYVYSSNCLIAKKGMKYPLMLDIKGSWPKSNQDDKYIVLERKNNLLLSCNNQPTQPNFFQRLPNENEIIATCDREDKFKINGKIFIISELQCNTTVTATLQETGEKCFTENTELIKVGYNIQQPEPSFIEVYSVCFDKSKKVPIYSSLIVTQEDQYQIEKPEWLKYENYFKANIGEYCNKDSKCCLKKIQLANEMNMANEPMKLATYIDGLNSVPYWHGCSSTEYTWSDLDDMLRNFWFYIPNTKISGALEYTSKNGLMVPRFLWKFVNDGDISRLVVIVNDPSPTIEDVRCTSSCGWDGWKEGSKQTFCCELDEFKEAFKLPGSSGHDDEYQFGKIFTDVPI